MEVAFVVVVVFAVVAVFVVLAVFVEVAVFVVVAVPVEVIWVAFNDVVFCTPAPSYFHPSTDDHMPTVIAVFSYLVLPKWVVCSKFSFYLYKK